ncbi:putative lipid-binding protein At4g00165 [Mercurialis annua]|uniref:putative lipid-binding protein At4g00165 n=1 Tax=Mercurialis annua TaxID=3986 RepID=UPI00216092DA|nr:putative lipid-binding protein At4g00165 [Mercurialis annua]
MAFNFSRAASLAILLNLLFFTCVSSHNVPKCPPPPSKPSTVPKPPGKCPKDTLKFGVCGSWLGLVHEVIGTKPSKECCTLIKGLADLEAALCLCTAIKANVLGVVKVEVPVAISLLLSACGKEVPQGFKCA